MIQVSRSLPALLVLLLVIPGSVYGASQRTFVKSTGVDTLPGPVPNTCSVASPCRSFTAAMLQTLPGGEVIVLDSAGYGAVTISQSVSIIAPPGVYAGVTVPPGGVGINMFTAGVTVVLQGLTISGTGSGGFAGYVGVWFQDGAELHVINCSISNFNQAGIYVTAPGSRVFVTDTTLRVAGGVVLSGSVTAVLDRVRGNDSGIVAANGGSLSVRDSVSSVWGSAMSGTLTRVTVDGTLSADSFAQGFSAGASDAGSRATFDVIRSTSTHNAGPGAVVDALPSAAAVMTVTSSVLSANNFAGLYNYASGGASTAFASRNSISGNTAAGIVQQATGIVHTRNDNAGEQTSPTMGTVTSVAGF